MQVLLLNISIIAICLIAAVLLARFCLRRYPKWIFITSTAVILALGAFLLTNMEPAVKPAAPQPIAFAPEAAQNNTTIGMLRNVAEIPSALPNFQSLTYYESGLQKQHIASLDDAQAEALHTVYMYSLLSSSRGSEPPSVQGDRFEIVATANGQEQLYVAFPTGNGYAFGLQSDSYYAGLPEAQYQLLLLIAEGGDTRNFTMSEHVSSFMQLLNTYPAYENAGFYAYACREVTPDMGTAAYQKKQYKLFKFKDSCASFLLYENKIYLIGEWFGGLGLVQTTEYEDGLLFTYSSGSGIHRSQIAYFDFAAREMKTLDYSLMNYDMMLQPVSVQQNENGLLRVFDIYQAYVTITGNDFTQVSLAANKCIGQLTYANGQFSITTYDAA